MRHILLRSLMLAVMAFVAIDATATVYTWSRYNLSFETPEAGFVTYQSNTRFEIHWEDMVMTIQLYSKDKGDDKKLLNENLQRKALGYSMYDLQDGRIKVKGFKVYSISGSMPDGSRAIIADLVSKRQNLIIEVTVNYLYGNRETVEDMVKSFAENKDQKPNRERKKQKVQKNKGKDLEKPNEQQRPARKEKLYEA